jgi:sugar/nucleoside kinase (ribokinase family)
MKADLTQGGERHAVSVWRVHAVPQLPDHLIAVARKRHPVIAIVGDLVQDITALLSSPIVNSGQVDARISRHRGGSAANIAAVLAGAGARSRFYGRVGQDELGDLLVEELANEGVEVHARREGLSATVVCLVEPTGERSFVADTAADARGRHVTDVPLSALADVDVLHLSGYWILGGVDIEALVGSPALPRCLTVDLGNVSRVLARGRSQVRRLLDQLSPSVVFANSSEAAEAGLIDGPHADRLSVVTCGALPTLIVQGVTKIAVPVPTLSTVVDTTGAGDAFVGGFLAAAARGSNLVQAVHSGHADARKVIQAPGATRAAG